MFMTKSPINPKYPLLLHVCVAIAVFSLSTEGSCDIVARYGGEFMAGGGARALSMGSAYTALSGDAWTLFWNPAGLPEVKTPEVGLMHSERFAGVVDYDAISLALPQPDASVLAFGVLRLGVNGIPFTRLEDPGSPISEGNRVEVEKFVNEGEYAFYVGKARRYKNWSWGIAPKLIFKHIGSDYRAYGLGIDAGVVIKPLPRIPIQAGLVMRDLLGTILAWEQTGRKEIITPTVRAGIAANVDFTALEARLTPTIDLSYRTENLGGSDAASVHLGMEYLVRKTVAIRIGSDDDRLTFGGGLILKPVSIDYAYIGHDDLGDTHRVSLTARWGK